MEDNYVAYVAGLFDGEGSLWKGHYTSGRDKKKRKRLVVKIAQVDRTVLDEIATEFQCGKVYSKGDKRSEINENWNECFEVVFTYRAARFFLTNIEPYVRIKKDKVVSLLDEFGREEI